LDEENELPVPKEPRDHSATPKQILDWVTHARKRGPSMWAWVLHRVTAVIILVAVIFHVMRNQFGLITPGGKIVSIDLLVFALAYHTFNGIRVILIEAWGWATEKADYLTWVVMFATIIFIISWLYIVGF
jgi:succinate dehydrogenase / fumarate reductase cytochrome b subunit